MGRELRRVPMDFDWPLKKTWIGFLNPFCKVFDQCFACGGNGYSPEANRLQDRWYGNSPFHPSETGSTPFTPDHLGVRAFAERNCSHSPGYYGKSEAAIIREANRLCDLWNGSWSHHLDADDVAALIEADRLWDFTRNPVTTEQEEIVRAKIADGGNSWLPESNGIVPTPQQVNDWSISSFGHDSLNCSYVISAKCKRMGVSETCAKCDGEGVIWQSQYAKKIYEDWQRIEPPIGDGWQVWETVSEGSPISPVFATRGELAEWLVDEGYSQDAAEGFIKHKWTMSGLSANGQFYSDIEACAIMK